MHAVPTLGPIWADVVFHVLAHARGTAHLPSSLYDPVYVEFCRGHLGPAGSRALEGDVATLERVLATHEALAAVQWVAWLFGDIREASAVRSRDLSDLRSDEVRTPAALVGLSHSWPAAELLRAAAELEASAHARLPVAHIDPRLGDALGVATGAAPRLGALRVECLRSLGRHGRVAAPSLFVGVPSEELGVSVEHVAMQAAHEATVVEVGESAAGRLSEREVEYAALLMLAERTQRAGSTLEKWHEAWWAALRLKP